MLVFAYLAVGIVVSVLTLPEKDSRPRASWFAAYFRAWARVLGWPIALAVWLYRAAHLEKEMG